MKQIPEGQGRTICPDGQVVNGFDLCELPFLCPCSIGPGRPFVKEEARVLSAYVPFFLLRTGCLSVRLSVEGTSSFQSYLMGRHVQSSASDTNGLSICSCFKRSAKPIRYRYMFGLLIFSRWTSYKFKNERSYGGETISCTDADLII